MRSGLLIGRPLRTGTNLSTSDDRHDGGDETVNHLAARLAFDLLSSSLIVERDDGELT